MSYVDALLVKDQDKILVVERKQGKRVYVEYPASYIFYYDDPRGKYKTIYETPVSRVFTRHRKEFQKELKIHNNVRTWESDFNPVFRCLSENYRHIDSPRLHTAFFDIETDWHSEQGFAPVEDPFNAITAITVYLDWNDQLITLAMPPKTITVLQGQEVADKFDNTFVFADEVDMINTFLQLIDDADVLSGWNSEGYDIPYVVNRMCKIMSKDDTRRLCLWDQFPKQRTFERYGAEQITYDLVGRVHVDYMQLYRKYTYEERHSFSLNAIGEYELGEHKTQYDGTLDQLYNNDFQKFIEYNRQDVALLAKLDKKLRFLDLANEIAHDNTVLIQTTMGAVAVTEQAIINECHDRGLIVPDRKRMPKKLDDDEEDGDGAAGAYVAYPKKGLHDWIGAIDLNSLYPSAIRMLNMGPETIVGQLRPDLTDAYIRDRVAQKMSFAKAWEGMFGTLEYQAVMSKDRATDITVDWENGTSTVMSGAEIHSLIWDQNLPLMLSANGTLFTSEREGIIPGLLARWYRERKDLQKKKADATEKEEQAFWDKRQLVKKISLNSIFGALLNPGCRFNDKRIGQSTTLSGRTISKHMNAYVNQCITGAYDHVGDAVIYADTDSVDGSSVVNTSVGNKTIQELFHSGTKFWKDGDKEYSVNFDIQVVIYDNKVEGPVVLGNYNYVYRHKTKKRRFKVTDTVGNQLMVTEDHAMIVLEHGKLIEKSPAELCLGQQLLAISDHYQVSEIAAVEELDPYDNEYVYDIGVSNANPYFFANNIMVHNSSYFSAWPMVKTDVGAGQLEWNKDICVGLYDNIAEQVNESFPSMCFAAFHAPEQNGKLIRCGRELVASKGLYITKKRYAVMIYDLEGKRLDQLTADEAKKKGIIYQVGKLKAMGLDLKRADTPKFVQDFLIEILTDLLTGKEKTMITDKIVSFKTAFRNLAAWEKGKPMRVNNLTRYRELESRKGKANLPGHVRASLNWNNLRNLNSDRRSLPIVDGMKVIVCKLRGNPMNYTSIAYPVDELRLPEWFKTLPFDQDIMEQIVVDTKVENLLSELNWDLKALTNPNVNVFKSLFTPR